MMSFGETTLNFNKSTLEAFILFFPFFLSFFFFCVKGALILSVMVDDFWVLSYITRSVTKFDVSKVEQQKIGHSISYYKKVS